MSTASIPPRPKITRETAHEAIAARRIIIAAVVLALLACGATAYWLWVLRDHRLQFTDRQIRLQTAAVAEHANFVFDAVDSSLRGTVRDVREGRMEPATAYRGLRQRVSGNPNLRVLSLVGSDGRVFATSWSNPPPPDRASTEGGTDGALVISNRRTNVYDGRTAVELSRGVAEPAPMKPLVASVADSSPDRPQQAQIEVERVVAVVDSEFVAEFFARVAAAKDAQVGLFKFDGTRLGGSLTLSSMSTPGSSDDDKTLVRSLLNTNADSTTEHGGLFVSAQRLNNLPLIVVSSRSREAVMAPWREYVTGALLVTALMLGLIAYAVDRLLREMRERVTAQAALESARRLESLGRLSGGIAHDFNNILAAIVGFADLLAQHVPAGSPQSRHVQQVISAGERGKRLVERILASSRGTPRVQSAVNIEAVVNEVLDMIAATAPASIRLEASLKSQEAFVLGDETQLFECISNLCTNALHAMPNGGALRIETSVFDTSAAVDISHGVLASGAYGRIVVSDEGIGMSREVLAHVFEPFFTTRGSSGGTGLGLAMVHGAVKEMNGVIDIDSRPASGTRFTLYLPIAARPEAAATVGHHESDEDSPRGCGQVVMVVDDEPALVAMTEETLAGLGYEPAGFRDASLALDVFRKAPTRFDALLTDQLMTGMSGLDLARAVHALRPDMPIVMATGFGGAQLEDLMREAGVRALLQKPVHRSELSRQMQRVFAPRSPLPVDLPSDR